MHVNKQKKSIGVKSMNEHFEMMPMIEPNRLFITEHHDHVVYEYYLMGSIGHPEKYLDLCHALRTAGPQDIFILRLNSGGGEVRTGNQIINALKESQAETVGFIEHDCGSMTTFIFLACQRWGVSKYAEWFSHTVSGGNYGKESETFEASQFLRKQTHKRIQEEYSNFLTDDEIQSILRGSDVYLDSDEIMERLEVFDEARANAPCDCGNPLCGIEEDQPSFDELVESAVTRALEQYEKKKANDEKKAARKAKPKTSKVTVEADSLTITGDVSLKSE